MDRNTALSVLQDLSSRMRPNCDLFGKHTLIISSDDFETIRAKYLDNKSEIWECRLMSEFIYPRSVEFSAEEVQMLREMSHKTGCPRDHVIREAVRRLYDQIMYRM